MAKEAKNKYSVDFAAYSKTLKDVGAAPSSVKKSSSKNIKDMLKSKESPLKKDTSTYKSKEYIDTSDDDSTDEEEKKNKAIKKGAKPVTKLKSEVLLLLVIVL